MSNPLLNIYTQTYQTYYNQTFRNIKKYETLFDAEVRVNKIEIENRKIPESGYNN
ncbi:MAG: hypothetical protein R6U04_01940 [Bacteroidales bacterium]